MTQQISPFLDSNYGWAYGESGWNTGMDENLLKFSFLFDRNIDGIVSSLPSVVNGKAYYLTTDNRIYFGVSNAWYSSPTPKWFTLILRSTGATYQFNGSALILISNNTDLSAQITAIQVTLSSLGTASLKDVEYFASSAQLDIASAQANNYTDTKTASITKTTLGLGNVDNTSDINKPVSTAQQTALNLKAPTLFQRSETGSVASTVDLKLKKIIHIEDFGGAGDNTTDNSTPLLNAISAASSYDGTGEVWFTSGTYLFNSAVNVTGKVTLRGTGKNSTRLVRNFTTGSVGVGLLNYTGWSGSICNMGIQTASGVTGGCLISLIAAATLSSPDFSLFDNLYLTYGSINSYANAIYINGSARTDNIGVRDIEFRACDMFGGTNGTLFADTTVNLRVSGSFFVGGSTSGKIQITASSTNSSYYTIIDANNLDGLSLNKCIYGDISAGVCVNQITNTSSVSYFALRGVLNAGYQNNWNNCTVSDPTGARPVTARPAKSSRTDPDGTITNYDTISLTTSWQTFTFSKAYTSAAAVLSLNGNCSAVSQATVYFQNVTATGYDATANAACTAKIRAEGY